MSGTMTKLYRSYVWLLEKLQSPFLLIIRLYWGWQFFLTGKGKLMNLDKTASFFAKATTVCGPKPATPSTRTAIP